MTNLNAYGVLMFIANIVLIFPIVLAVLQQAKASMNVALVVSIVYLFISVGFFSENFPKFFSRIGLTISPVCYALIAIFAFFIARDFGELRVRQGIRKTFWLSVTVIAMNIFDFFWVGTAALIPLISMTWGFGITTYLAITKWNIQ